MVLIVIARTTNFVTLLPVAPVAATTKPSASSHRLPTIVKLTGAINAPEPFVAEAGQVINQATKKRGPPMV